MSLIRVRWVIRMSAELLKRTGKWLFEKLADVIVYLMDLWVRFLYKMGWSRALKVKKDKKH